MSFELEDGNGRFCISCFSRIIRKGQWSEKEFIFDFYCMDCDTKPPNIQPEITNEHWAGIAEKIGIPFYKRSADDILAEIEKEDITYVAIFRRYDAHPHEEEIPNHLRSVCHLLYDEVRSKQMKTSSFKRIEDEVELRKKVAQIPAQMATWANKLELKSVTKAYQCLFFFEIDWKPYSLSVREEIRLNANQILEIQ